MTTFWIIATLLTLLALVGLMPALWRQAKNVSDDTREQNITIARERVAEMDAELAAGTMSQSVYDQAKVELERGLLDDVSAKRVDGIQQDAKYGRGAMVALVLAIPLISVYLYQQYGAPQHMDVSGPGQPANTSNTNHAATSGKAAPTMSELLTMLEQRVKDKPEDAEALFMLSRTYTSMGKYDKAVPALEKLAEMTENHPTVLVSLADAMAMQNGGVIAGRSFELVLQVLDVDPDNITALWLAGNGSAAAKDYQNALYYWRRAEGELADKPEMLPEVRELIQNVKNAASAVGLTLDDPGSSVADTVVAGIALRVTLTEELKNELQASDRLFIFAKAVNGPPMPLAAIRKTAGDLPLEVVMSDANMLRPGSKLQDLEQVQIAARIAKSGQPMASSGDLQSASVVVNTNTEQQVELVINQIVP